MQNSKIFKLYKGMEGDMHRSWKEILEQLSERRPAVRINVLDIIALDRLGVCRPLFWASTSPQGSLQCKNVRNKGVDEVVQAALVMMQPKDPRECLALGLSPHSRFVLKAKELYDIGTLVAAGLEGLVLLKAPGRKFDRRVFVHEIRMAGRGYEDNVQVGGFPGLSQAGERLKQSPTVKKKLRPKSSWRVFGWLNSCY